jgi:tRNA 2-thiocytidine biosynthesis protein TtcA
MLSHGDRIAVGLSGGKDSLTLLWFLQERLPRIPIDYELIAIYIDPGFEGGFGPELQTYCAERGYTLKVAYTDYGILAHSERNRENPCFLCARLRRKRLFEIAVEAGCNKIALGHNKDDLIETLFMNMCYAGEISTMIPIQSFFGDEFRLIRPLAYADANSIRRFAREKGFPEFVNPCPSAQVSKRREIRDMLDRLYRSNRKIKGNVFRAMHHVRLDYLLK